MEVDRLLTGVRAITPDGEVTGSIAIDEGRIAAIIPAGEGLPEARDVVDAGGALALPGLIDTHTHARDPSVDAREDFESATAAAAAGGITTILEMPISTPAVSSSIVLRQRAAVIAPKAHVDFGLYGGAGADNVDDIEGLAAGGAVGYKTFRTPMPAGREREFSGLVATDAADAFAAFRVVARTGLVAAVHAEDAQLLIARELQLRSGGIRGPRTHARWRLPVVEESSVAQTLELARAAGVRIQIAHASTAHAVSLVSRARADGVAATVETCPHYLFLDDTALDRHGPFAKINPPLRSAETVEALWERVRAGEVDVIGSDHSPFLVEEKAPFADDIWRALPGTPGLEAMLPLLLTAVAEERIRLEQLVALAAGNAARIFGLAAKGRLAVGADADLALVEIGGPWRIDTTAWLTRAREAARVWHGREVRGRVVATYLRGQRVWDRTAGVTAPPGSGRQVRPTA
jgi:dihydropyrimidinase/allantoinase